MYNPWGKHRTFKRRSYPRPNSSSFVKSGRCHPSTEYRMKGAGKPSDQCVPRNRIFQHCWAKAVFKPCKLRRPFERTMRVPPQTVVEPDTAFHKPLWRTNFTFSIRGDTSVPCYQYRTKIAQIYINGSPVQQCKPRKKRMIFCLNFF